MLLNPTVGSQLTFSLDDGVLTGVVVKTTDTNWIVSNELGKYTVMPSQYISHVEAIPKPIWVFNNKNYLREAFLLHPETTFFTQKDKKEFFNFVKIQGSLPETVPQEWLTNEPKILWWPKRWIKTRVLPTAAELLDSEEIHKKYLQVKKDVGTKLKTSLPLYST